MDRYEVVIPWYGVKKGQIVETATLHPAIRPNVRKVTTEPQSELTPATPAAATRRGRPHKAEPQGENAV